MGYYSGILSGGGPRSTGEILSDTVHDIQDLFRSEVRLAKAEVSDQLDHAKAAGGMFGAAAVSGLFAGMCLIAACIAALALVMPLWAAALIMTAILGFACALFYDRARRKTNQIDLKPKHTVETLKEDVQWLKQRTR